MSSHSSVRLLCASSAPPLRPLPTRLRQTIASGAYTHFRRVRGDGNCFYRAYVYAVLEWMAGTMRDGAASDEERRRVREVLARVRDSLAALRVLGYENMEDFHE
jgi:hypothetical protein